MCIEILLVGHKYIISILLRKKILFSATNLIGIVKSLNNSIVDIYKIYAIRIKFVLNTILTAYYTIKPKSLNGNSYVNSRMGNKIGFQTIYW